MSKHVYIFLCRLALLFAVATEMNTAYSQAKIQWKGIAVSEDDDFFNFRGQGTDRGYTCGLNITLYYKKIKKPAFPGNLLLKIPGKADNLYGYGLSQSLWTPNNITNKEIQYNDYPYAAVLLLSNFLISADPENKQKLTTRISVGTIGKYAFGKEIQTWFHRMIDYQQPNGWDNQVTTDILLDYSIEFEKLLFSPCPNFEVIGSAAANAGTFINSGRIGVQLRAGVLNSYFDNSFFDRTKMPKAGKNKVHFYVYTKMNECGIMDNAALEGGFFTHNKSPYVIPKDNINRAILQYEYGFVLTRKHTGFSISEKVNTPEFKGSYAQQTGNVTILIGL
ncbi:MAG: lipid A deacylase LpxR family protein, partial [Bacteroidota bacterium]